MQAIATLAKKGKESEAPLMSLNDVILAVIIRRQLITGNNGVTPPS